MRILQLIDSLEPGGAERMAVNYANSLATKIEFSGLVATRKEGNLKNQIAQNVSYLFLDRKKTFDFGAVFRLRKFIKCNKVQILHAHSTSFFLAFLLKLTLPEIKLVWHDHFGNSEFLSNRKTIMLKIASLSFDGSIAVNKKLKIWASKKLYNSKIISLFNFVSFDESDVEKTVLKGVNGKRILCLANLREQKNHFFLLEVATKINIRYPDWSFHLVGKDFKDSYSEKIKRAIQFRRLEKVVFLYNSCDDIKNIINQSEIGVLTSISEGLPVSILEYGYFEKPVVSTNVGQINSVISHHVSGYLTKGNGIDEFTNYLEKLILDFELRKTIGKKLREKIIADFTAESVIFAYLNFIKSIS